jgi:hypothetical protein
MHAGWRPIGGIVAAIPGVMRAAAAGGMRLAGDPRTDPANGFK